MKLWELRSYDAVIKLEQERLVYRARLHSRYGRAWRRKAPVESLMPLRLARYGVPLAETAPSGLAAAGIEPVLLPPAPRQPDRELESSQRAGTPGTPVREQGALEYDSAPDQAPQQEAYARRQEREQEQQQDPESSPWFAPPHQEVVYEGGYDPSYEPVEQYDGQQYDQQWYQEQRQAQEQAQYQDRDQAQEYEPGPEDTGSWRIPSGPGGRTRQLGEGGGTPEPPEPPEPDEESYYQVFKQSINGSYPTPREFIDNVEATYGSTLLEPDAKRMVKRFTNRHTAELQDEHIA
jgi:hypothetical protein